MRESLDFVVKRPLEDVFRALTDLEMMTRFAQAPDAPVKMKVEPVPDRPRSGLGSALRVSVDGAGQSLLMETTEWDPPRRCVRRLASPDLEVVVTFDFEETPAGTRVAAGLVMEAKSLLMKMALPLLAKRIASEKAAFAEQLKDRLA
ncbi:MAG: SRPBCC family protein [Elusimicrobia bacterium]|nr:SRPBCC family protein [Elusimicrobiota bacterium]